MGQLVEHERQVPHVCFAPTRRWEHTSKGSLMFPASIEGRFSHEWDRHPAHHHERCK